MENNIITPPSIFKVTTYEYQNPSPRKAKYPCFKLRKTTSSFHLSLYEAEEKVKNTERQQEEFSEMVVLDTYAHVITELPLGMAVNTEAFGQSLSEWVYGPDGSLLGEREYCNFIPSTCKEPEEFDNWVRLCLFKGRKPEEVKFKPGDIVEIFGFPGNDYWNDGEVNLAIIVKCPPTEEEVTTMLNQHLDNQGTFDVIENRLWVLNNLCQDNYEVLSLACDGIDHSPTFATFSPTLKVSPRLRNRLQRLYEQYKSEQ